MRWTVTLFIRDVGQVKFHGIVADDGHEAADNALKYLRDEVRPTSYRARPDARPVTGDYR